MKKCTHKNIIIAAISIAAVVSLLVINMFDLRYWFSAKTGLLYPAPQKIDKISDVEEIWRVSFPEGSYIEGQLVGKDGGTPVDITYVKYKPYYYKVRVTIPLEKTEEFAENVRSFYNDQTIDCFGNKDELFNFPEIISDLEEKELTYSFSHIEDCPPNGKVIICTHRRIYIFEEEDKTTVYLCV